MQPPEIPGEENPDAANARLNEGLRSCRAVVSNYRSLLTGDPEAGDEQAETADPDEAEKDPAK